MTLMGSFAIKPELLKPRVAQKGHLADSVDPDQMPQNVASDQGLHSVHEMQEFDRNMVSMKINQTYGSGLVQRLKIEGSTWHKYVKVDLFKF